jgi:hypothetical protein
MFELIPKRRKRKIPLPEPIKSHRFSKAERDVLVWLLPLGIALAALGVYLLWVYS